MLRPWPQAGLLTGFVPDDGVEQWIKRHIIKPGGALYNPDHIHLAEARIGVLWAGDMWARKGMVVLGSAEIPQAREGGWKRARHDQQLLEWFTEIPDFLITLYAPFCATASDTNFCALIEHELYHCAQQTDEFGSPRYSRDTGAPLYTIVGHDVEEFVGVVRRYGAEGVANERLRALVMVAGRKPEVGQAQITGACGNCKLKLVG
jgi:hypothetical protein